MENKVIDKEKGLGINTTTLRKKARKLLLIMLILVMLLRLIEGAVNLGWDTALVFMVGMMVVQPIFALLYQCNLIAMIPLFISVILAMSSSISICNILMSKDSNKITKSFRKLKNKVIIMLVFDCVVFIWFFIKGFPSQPLTSSGNTKEIDIFADIMIFIYSYVYSIFNIIYTGILCLITKKENDVFEVED